MQTTQTTSIVMLAKKANKSVIENLSTIDSAATGLNDTLKSIDKITSDIRILQSEKKVTVQSAVKLLNDYIRELKTEEQFSKYATKLLIKIIKGRLDTKSTLISLVIKYLEEGLTIQHNMSISALNYAYKAYKGDRISKTVFKDAVKLEAKIKALKEEDKKSISAK